MLHSLRKTLLKMPSLAMLLMTGSLVGSNNALAEACTYREAIMALERGNVDRGLALMRMASRDGDRRAVSYLLEQDYAQSVVAKESVEKELPSLAFTGADLN